MLLIRGQKQPQGYAGMRSINTPACRAQCSIARKGWRGFGPLLVWPQDGRVTAHKRLPRYAWFACWVRQDTVPASCTTSETAGSKSML